MKLRIKQIWIDPKTARPKNGEDVIIYSTAGRTYIVHYYNGFNRQEKMTEEENAAVDMSAYVVAWMPLPEPPRGYRNAE